MNDHVVDSGLLPMDGVCDEGFAPVREAFVKNFTELGEPGAAIPLFVDGRLVVDLWGGWKACDRREPWRRETLVHLLSVGKALKALCVLRVVGKGMIDLYSPLAPF